MTQGAKVEMSHSFKKEYLEEFDVSDLVHLCFVCYIYYSSIWLNKTNKD